MEQYLRCYVSYQQDDWVKWLPMAEFAANNHESAATKATPFFGHYGFHPRFIHSVPPVDRLPQSLDAKAFATTMNDLQDHLRTQMRTAQDRYEESTNKSRVPAPAFQIGDKVFLSAKNIRTARLSRKLDWKRLGPYPVKKVISAYAYELDLPPSIKLHPVFHVSLLDPAPHDPVPGQLIPPPPPVIIDDNLEYEIEEVLDSKLVRNRLKYYIKWTGHHDPTWEPVEYHDDSEAVELFHQRYPHKPGPLKD